MISWPESFESGSKSEWNVDGLSKLCLYRVYHADR